MTRSRPMKQSNKPLPQPSPETSTNDAMVIDQINTEDPIIIAQEEVQLTDLERETQFKNKIKSMGGVSMGGMALFSQLPKQPSNIILKSNSPTEPLPPVIVDEEKLKVFIDTVVDGIEWDKGYHFLLKSGVVLCKILSKLNGEEVKVNNGKFKFCWYENIQKYLAGCDIYGLDSRYAFNVDNLVDGLEMDTILIHIQVLLDVKK